MGRLILTSLLASLLAAPAVPDGHAARRPQSLPDFSGRWVCVSPLRMSEIEMTVTQTARTLRADTGVASLAMTYTLDGAETRHVFPLSTGDIVVLARATWRGSTLEIDEHSTYPDEPKTHRTQTWSMKGSQLAVLYNVETDGRPRPQIADSLWRRK
jgi:hypothetical protein